MVEQADSDEQLLELWLHGRPANTERGYRSEVNRFLDWANKPLRQIKLLDLQQFVQIKIFDLLNWDHREHGI